MSAAKDVKGQVIILKLKRLCRVLVFIASAAVLCSLFSITAFAKSSAEFYIPDGAVPAGEEFEVTVKFTSDKNIDTVETNFVYDDSAVRFVSGDGASGGGGILTVKEFPSSKSKELSVTLRFTALKKGTSEMSLSNCAVSSQDFSHFDYPTAYASITVGNSNGTVTTVPPSDSAIDSSQSPATSATTATDENGIPAQGILTSLTVSEGKLIPSFSYDIYDYVVKVDNSVDYCEIEGITASPLDYIWYTGSKYLQVGDNIRTITVTDNDGNEHTYTITIQRAGEPEAASQNETETHTQAVTSSVRKTTADKPKNNLGAFDKYKQVLIPALGIVMFVLILALVILIVWLRKKAEERRELKEEEKARRKRKSIQTKKK